WHASDAALFGYAAAYQVNGGNIDDNVAAGAGAEQDLFAGYELEPTSKLSISSELALVLYPAASPHVAGVSVPLFADLSSELRYPSGIELGLYVSYLSALRRGPERGDYVYLSPRLVKGVRFGRRVDLDFFVSGGVKLFEGVAGPRRDNVFDLLATVVV